MRINHSSQEEQRQAPPPALLMERAIGQKKHFFIKSAISNHWNLIFFYKENLLNDEFLVLYQGQKLMNLN